MSRNLPIYKHDLEALMRWYLEQVRERITAAAVERALRQGEGDSTAWSDWKAVVLQITDDVRREAMALVERLGVDPDSLYG